MSAVSCTVYDCSDSSSRTAGVAAAIRAARAGQLVVLPTDTVYGIGADAFNAAAIAALLQAKQRGSDMPVPVLVGNPGALEGVATGIDERIRQLVQRFWPGALTLICTQQPSLAWDLGQTNGTVAVRMPDHPVALELLEQVGPMGVSSANLTGQPAPQTAAQAREDLGANVAVYLDAGPTAGSLASTIVDLTVQPPRLVRQGGVTAQQLRELLPELETPTGAGH